MADFNSMGKIISALRDLPAGGSTNLIIDGQSVTMTGRKISMMGSAIRSAALMAPTVDAGMESSYAGVSTPLTLTRTEERDGVSFNFIPTGTDTGMLAATHRKGDFFASAALGTRGDFFGFTNGHGEVKEANITAGHKNIFAHFGRQWSDNGLSVDSAEGEYVGFTLRKGMKVSENMSLSSAAHTTRFLGGEADIHRASVNLGKSGWEHKLSLSTGIALTEDSALSISADALFPETGSEQNVFARYLLRF